MIIWSYSINTYTQRYSFVEVPGASCCSSGFLASWFYCLSWTSWGWGTMSPVVRPEWWKRRTHTSTLHAPATGPHPYIMTSLSPGCCLLEPGILVCGDTGLIQHGLPLSNEFSLFTLPILGVDLHCDSRPSVPSPSSSGIGIWAEMNSLSSESQKQSVRSLRRREREPRCERKETPYSEAPSLKE